MKQGVMQFILIKPLTSILTVILIELDLYDEGDFSLNKAYIYISFINNISISVSLYCLVLFYMGFEKKLLPFRPLSKFLCIKFVLFFSFWQSCFLILLAKFEIFTQKNSKLLQELLICFEMVIAAIAHSFAFSYKDFIDYSKPENPFFKNLGKVLDVKDLLADAEKTFMKNQENDDLQLEEITHLKK